LYVRGISFELYEKIPAMPPFRRGKKNTTIKQNIIKYKITCNNYNNVINNI
jgi:hypothetical protein